MILYSLLYSRLGEVERNNDHEQLVSFYYSNIRVVDLLILVFHVYFKQKLKSIMDENDLLRVQNVNLKLALQQTVV